MARVAAVALHTIERLAGDARPSYVRVAPPAPSPSSRGGGSGDTFLGVTVDARVAAGGGLHLSGAPPGGAAARARGPPGGVAHPLSRRGVPRLDGPPRRGPAQETAR